MLASRAGGEQQPATGSSLTFPHSWTQKLWLHPSSVAPCACKFCLIQNDLRWAWAEQRTTVSSPEAGLQGHALLSASLLLLSPDVPLVLRQLPTSNNCNMKTSFSKQECTWLRETTGKERVRGKVFDSLPFTESQHTISIHVIFLARQKNNFL